jgi:hypothetical protein
VRQNLELARSSAKSNCDLSRTFGSLDNNISCNGARANVCQTALIFRASLQDLMNQGRLSSRSKTYAYVVSVASRYCSN